MDLRQVVNEIRLGVVREVPPQMAEFREASLRLRMAFEDMQALAELVGEMPPNPGTLRAAIGARLVRVVRRMLFWYTPQIVRFHMAASAFAEQACIATERHAEALQAVNRRLDDLSRRIPSSS